MTEILWCQVKLSRFSNLHYFRLLFKIPRVVLQQKDKFEEEDIFKKHSRDGEVRFTLYRDRPAHERQAKFQAGCRDGHTEIVSKFEGIAPIWSLHHVNVGIMRAPFYSQFV